MVLLRRAITSLNKQPAVRGSVGQRGLSLCPFQRGFCLGATSHSTDEPSHHHPHTPVKPCHPPVILLRPGHHPLTLPTKHEVAIILAGVQGGSSTVTDMKLIHGSVPFRHSVRGRSGAAPSLGLGVEVDMEFIYTVFEKERSKTLSSFRLTIETLPDPPLRRPSYNVPHLCYK